MKNKTPPGFNPSAAIAHARRPFRYGFLVLPLVAIFIFTIATIIRFQFSSVAVGERPAAPASILRSSDAGAVGRVASGVGR